MPSIDIVESDRRKQYNAAAGQTDFVTDFPCFSADDVKAIVDGTEVTAFTVSGLNTESGFTVVFDTPMVGGEVVTIYSQTVIARGSQYQVGGRFDAPPLERDLDKITTILQEQKRNIDQTVAFGQDVLGVSGSIGAPVDGSVLIFSGTGGAIVAGPTGTEIANAQGYATAAGVSQTNAAASASTAAASAAAAAASAAEGMWNDVDSLVFGDSPYVPDGIEEGTLFRCDCTGGDIVINLSTLATYAEDMKFGFVKIDASANKITINRGGTDTINGATYLDITKQWQPHALIGDLESGSWIDTVQAAATTAADISADNTGNTYLTATTAQGQLDQVEAELDTSNGANELVRLDGTGKLPAVDGSLLTNLPTPSGGVVITRQVFTSSGTWTKPANLLYVEVEVQGGGGGGARGLSTSHGPGGGGGGYARKLIAESALGSTETVTRGGGGAGGSASNGSTGGTSSFGSHCSASGGEGANQSSTIGGLGGAGSGGDLNVPGSPGGGGELVGSGGGGSSFLGAGGRARAYSSGAGTSGLQGGGGSGGHTAQTGGAGGSGLVIITEYKSA